VWHAELAWKVDTEEVRRISSAAERKIWDEEN
jgi:hypothetical protein